LECGKGGEGKETGEKRRRKGLHEGKGWNGLVREGKARLENGKGSERREWG